MMKTSKKLQDLMDQIYHLDKNYNLDFVSNINLEYVVFYEDRGVDEVGVNLCKKSIKLRKPIYVVYTIDYILYFIDTLKEIEKDFKHYLKYLRKNEKSN